MRERHWVLHTGTVYRARVDTDASTQGNYSKVSHVTQRLLIANSLLIELLSTPYSYYMLGIMGELTILGSQT